MNKKIAIDERLIAEFCERNKIREMSLFGSILRDDFTPDSDIDILVKFQLGAAIGLLKMAEMELELSIILGRKVDLRSPMDLSRYFRDKVLTTAEVIYAV